MTVRDVRPRPLLRSAPRPSIIFGCSGYESIHKFVPRDLSTLIVGDAKIEVDADGKKVAVYDSEGVEIKSTGAAAAAAGATGTHKSLFQYCAG